MSKKYRYFIGLYDTQEKWINKMSEKGWRLIKTSTFSYEFEECDPCAYEYRVEFVGAKSYGKIQDYIKLLTELGYRVFTKNLNLNLSFGKMRWRPYGKGAGQVVTSPGGYNKEILIIEKKRDGESFELHTNYEDIIFYYQSIRSKYLSLILIVVIFAVVKLFVDIETLSFAVLGVAMVLLLIPTFLYTREISVYKRLSRVNE